MEPKKAEEGGAERTDIEAARFWLEPAEDRAGEFDDK